MSAVADLLALQETDLALDKALKRLAEIEESLGESEELIEARRLLEERAAALHETRSGQKDSEFTVEEVRTKATNIEKKLYGGTVKNPKELQDYDLDLKSLRQQLKNKEDEYLVILETAEAADAERAAAQEAFDSLFAAWGDSQAAMNAEKAQIEPEVTRLRGIRDSQSTDVDRRLVSLYDLLRVRRGGQAVARVERGMCQGCRITLPVSILQRARTGVGYVQCVSCERILLLT